MEFQRLLSSGDAFFPAAFALYEISFPKHEQRIFERQAALMKNPLYHFDVILEAGAFAGILLHWEGSGYSYVEHFAVSPSLRGKSIGSGALGRFSENRPLVVLEIDPPADEISVRREQFYRRLGFRSNSYLHLHPAYRPEFSPHELVVMSCPREMTEEEYRLFQRELAETVMKDAPKNGVTRAEADPPPEDNR